MAASRHQRVEGLGDAVQIAGLDHGLVVGFEHGASLALRDQPQAACNGRPVVDDFPGRIGFDEELGLVVSHGLGQLRIRDGDIGDAGQIQPR